MCGKSSLKWTGLVILTVIALLLTACSQTSGPSNVPVSPVSGTSPGTDSSVGPVETTPVQAAPSEISVAADPDLHRDDSVISVGTDNWTPQLTRVEDLHITGSTQHVDIASYSFTVDGLVETPLKLSYEELQRFAPVTKVVTLVCPEFFVDIAEWTGVPVVTLLNLAAVKPEAAQVLVYSVDGYWQTLPLQTALKDGVFLAYKVNGQVLPEEHGYPVRLVGDGEYGSSWVKWVNRIEVK
jgi:DMSO/TMAO reductase YedYZ molybdopterin-dependent catalytic subunit